MFSALSPSCERPSSGISRGRDTTPDNLLLIRRLLYGEAVEIPRAGRWGNRRRSLHQFFNLKSRIVKNIRRQLLCLTLRILTGHTYISEIFGSHISIPVQLVSLAAEQGFQQLIWHRSKFRRLPPNVYLSQLSTSDRCTLVILGFPLIVPWVPAAKSAVKLPSWCRARCDCALRLVVLLEHSVCFAV